MKREIKFRAWDKEGNNYSGWRPQMVYQHEWMEKMECPGYPMPLPYKNNRYEWMQYTGLKDKNGKEIYEGDVLSGNDGYYTFRIHYEVYWRAEYFAWWVRRYTFEGTRIGTEEPLHYLTSRDAEIIGNIHANPELLTK